MKTLPLIIAMTVSLTAYGHAQTVVPFENFEPPAFTTGPLHGQGGWTVTNVSGTIAYAVVSNFAAYSGAQSAYLVDNDPSNNPKAWREPTGANVTHGRIDFAVKESPYTSGRDYWTVVFSNTGASTANFKLSLSSANMITLYGGSGGSTPLAMAFTTSVNGNYDPSSWNTFSVVFNETAGTADIYLNGGSSPYLTATDAVTNWTVGRVLICPGASSYINMGVFFDMAQPEWETTNKLRYAPPTLVAPTIWTPARGFASGTFSPDEDVIVQFSSTQTRTGNCGVVGGRNVRIIGGDLGNTYLAPSRQTATVYLEGLKIDQSSHLPIVNGCRVELKPTSDRSGEKDGIDVCGTTTGSGANVFVQNCSIRGVHGTRDPHGAGVQVAAITCTGTIGNSFTATFTTTAPMTIGSGETWVIVGANSEPKLNGMYRINTVGGYTGTAFSGVRWDSHNPLPPAPFGPSTSGTGGYAWPEVFTGPFHADAFQSMAEGMYQKTYFYRVTMESNAECFLGMNQHNTQGARGLVMTRVNMMVNNVWPQVYDSASLYIGTTSEAGGGWGSDGFPVTLDRVYIQPRAQRNLTAAVYPGVNTTRSGTNVGAFSTDGGQTVEWPAALQVTGKVTKSNSGFPGEAGFTATDYADLTGPNAPGLNYVSPGYSSDAAGALNITAITGTPVITGTLTIPASSGTGTVVTRLDVGYSGEGHIINLSLGDPSGKFGMDTVNKRNVIVKAPLSTGIYHVTGTATQNGTPSNVKTQTFTIRVQ